MNTDVQCHGGAATFNLKSLKAKPKCVMHMSSTNEQSTENASWEGRLKIYNKTTYDAA